MLQTLLLLAVLAQSPAVHTFRDARRSYTLYESPTLVAEPRPSDATRAAVLALDPLATVTLERPTMRLWKVRDAAAVRAKLGALRPVFHDVASGAGRLRVPLGLVCGGQRVEAAWDEVLARSGAECLPDFWYVPVLR